MQGPPLNTRRGRRPRRPQKRHPYGVPFCYSSSEGAKLSLAVRPGIIKGKKRSTPQKSSIYYPSRGSGRHIYLSPAAAGDIYFVCAVRPGIIKRKKESPRRKTIFTIPPASAGGIIKRKKRKAQRLLPIRKHREERENGIASAVPFSHFSIDAVTFDISKAPIPL